MCLIYNQTQKSRCLSFTLVQQTSLGTKNVQTVCELTDFHDEHGKPRQLIDMIFTPRIVKMLIKEEEMNYVN